MEQKQIRHNFIRYLKTHYNYARPENMASNVFYVWQNDIGMDFWDIFKSESSMRKAQELLIAKFEKVGRKDPKGHAAVHYGCWEKFREFLLADESEIEVKAELAVSNIPKPILKQQEHENNNPVINTELDLGRVMDALKIKRRLFHSEADFQFALAWEIQTKYPKANVRLEYCPVTAPNMHIDILVTLNGRVYPIELKYKTLGLDAVVDTEVYHLKSHGAQDNGKYDCLLDLQRSEKYSAELPHFCCGFVIWLTNDPYYWTKSKRQGTMAANFSIYEGAVKTGSMAWADHTGIGTMKGREIPIVLEGTYTVLWRDYSIISDDRSGQFQYAMFAVNKEKIASDPVLLVSHYEYRIVVLSINWTKPYSRKADEKRIRRHDKKQPSVL